MRAKNVLIEETVREMPAEVGFSDFWVAFPRKIAKLDAIKAYSQALKRGATHEQIMDSLGFMLATEWKGRELRYLPYPASWLRREAFEERCESLHDELPLFASVKGQHHCGVCRTNWRHECDINCQQELERTCPECIGAMWREVRKGVQI